MSTPAASAAARIFTSGPTRIGAISLAPRPPRPPPRRGGLVARMGHRGRVPSPVPLLCSAPQGDRQPGVRWRLIHGVLDLGGGERSLAARRKYWLREINAVFPLGLGLSRSFGRNPNARCRRSPRCSRHPRASRPYANLCLDHYGQPERRPVRRDAWLLRGDIFAASAAAQAKAASTSGLRHSVEGMGTSLLALASKEMLMMIEARPNASPMPCGDHP